jgi:hypothetical protein
MSLYKAGQAGPIPLQDGRVVTAEQGDFELEISSPHDADLAQRGVIVPAETAPVEPPVETVVAPAPPQTTAPAAGEPQTTPPAAGEKAGE